jgi:citronellol/citronellal dehydrogenase
MQPMAAQVAYTMTKVGMTVLVHGLAGELKDLGVAITALWPTMAIGSLTHSLTTFCC